MQNIKKYFMTLALLLTAVTGAWAQSSPNVVEFDVPADWENDDSKVTAADLPGFKAVTLAEAQAWTGAPAEYMALFVYAFDGDNICFVPFFYGTAGNEDKPTYTKDGIFNQKSNNVKFYYPAEITEWSLTPDETGKKWTLAEMPASDVELQVEYFAESNLFLGKEALADKANIAVKNGETTVAFDDDGKSTTTVTEGNTVTAKFTGKKVLGMKVEKKSLLSIQITGPTEAIIYYFEGETWEQAIQNHPEENSAWSIDQEGYISCNGYYLYAGGNLVNSNDTIAPNAGYHFPLS